MTQAEHQPRGHGEAVLDVRYGMRYSDLNARLYDRIDLVFSFLSMAAGSGAVASVINASPLLASTSGVVLAAVAVLGQLIQPARKAERHAQAKVRFAELDARSAKLSLNELDRELRVLQGSAPTAFSSLARPAFNANLRSHGYAGLQEPLSLMERFMEAVA